MTSNSWRDELWSQMDRSWDMIVIGGGITGAGILREATRLGLRVLLLEQRDFAWGTSSRSSKLVHGGLRYLSQGQPRLTYESVRERQFLLENAPGLVDPLGFLLATYKGDRPGRFLFSIGLALYDAMAGEWAHRFLPPEKFLLLAPRVRQEGLVGGFHYVDAQTDDARLVFRVIQEAMAEGGAALNYARVTRLIREDGTVSGVEIRDSLTGREATLRARVVVNATGAWADDLRRQVGQPPRLRPIRGSHLVFPAWRLPVAQAVSFLHPVDRRPVFVIPWEGVTLVGTTDVDHHEPLNREPRISPQEAAYLMTAVQTEFPSLALELDDVQATFAGVRPVVGTGKADPSKESREHVVWQEDGLLTVTGGKLTTFRLIALDAITAARSRLPDLSPVDRSLSMLNPVSDDAPGLAGLDSRVRRRLLGRYGALAPLVVEDAAPDELTAIPGTRTLWAELRWAARREHVVHLDDLLLRRVRLGLLLPKGGAELLPQIREICQAELAWDDERWAAEESAYLVLWQAHHAPPKTVPESELQPRAATPVLKRTVPARRVALFLAGLLTVASMTGIGLWRWMVAGRGREKVCA